MHDQAKLQLAFLGQAEIRLNGNLPAARLPLKGLAYLAVTGQPCSRESLTGPLPDLYRQFDCQFSSNRCLARSFVSGLVEAVRRNWLRICQQFPLPKIKVHIFRKEFA